VGRIGSHLCVAYIQEPRRLEQPQQLFRYCRLGIRDRSSDNKPLGFQQLDRNGHGVLKAISLVTGLGWRQCWPTRMQPT
jgi:hypothetical protein